MNKWFKYAIIAGFLLGIGMLALDYFVIAKERKALVIDGPSVMEHYDAMELDWSDVTSLEVKVRTKGLDSTEAVIEDREEMEKLMNKVRIIEGLPTENMYEYLSDDAIFITVNRESTWSFYIYLDNDSMFFRRQNFIIEDDHGLYKELKKKYR